MMGFIRNAYWYLQPSGVAPPSGSAVTPEAWALLLDEYYRGNVFEEILARFRVNKLWAEHRDYIVAEWAARHPGTRPNNWWLKERHGAARRQLSGEEWDGWNYWRGAPNAFKERGHVGPIAVFESQAAYLLRNSLFFPGESERLTSRDLEPVSHVLANNSGG